MNPLIKKLGLEVIGEYKYFEDLLGGKAATLCKYKDDSGNVVLFKFLIAPRNDNEIEFFLNEADTLKTLTEHQSEIKGFPLLKYPLKEFREIGLYYFGFEFIEGISLRKYFEIKPLPWNWQDALKLLFFIVQSLSSISRFFITHRDLHPGNIQLHSGFDLEKDFKDDKNNVVILDLGCSENYLKKYYSEVKLARDYFRHFGALSSWSPEFLQNPNDVDVRSDIWALGSLLFNLLTNKYPITASNFGEYYANCVINYNLNIETIKDLHLPFCVETLLFRMLHKNPSVRLLHRQINQIIVDILEGTILKKSEELQKEYMAYGGDIWECIHCGHIGAPNGNKCRGCGRFNESEDWRKPF